MYRIENIKIREELDKEELIEFICKKYRISKEDILSWSIYKKSVDARDKNDIFYNYTIDIEANNKIKQAKIIKKEKIELINLFKNCIKTRPVDRKSVV